MTWNVLCPGPSLSRLQPSRGRISVAVNSAIFSPHAAQFWAVQDDPEHFAAKASDFFKRAHSELPIVWCREEMAAKWRELGYPVWPHPTWEADFRKAFPILRPPNPPNFEYQGLTSVMAMVRAASCGATTIQLYGCDLEGRGYSFGKDYRKRPNEDWDSRWELERKTMEVFFADMERRGIQILREGLV